MNFLSFINEYCRAHPCLNSQLGQFPRDCKNVACLICLPHFQSVFIHLIWQINFPADYLRIKLHWHVEQIEGLWFIKCNGTCSDIPCDTLEGSRCSIEMWTTQTTRQLNHTDTYNRQVNQKHRKFKILKFLGLFVDKLSSFVAKLVIINLSLKFTFPLGNNLPIHIKNLQVRCVESLLLLLHILLIHQILQHVPAFVANTKLSYSFKKMKQCVRRKNGWLCTLLKWKSSVTLASTHSDIREIHGGIV